MAAAEGEEDAVAPDECRICRMPAEKAWPLFHPCKCRGSIKHIHQDCLQQWLSHSNTQVCELCNTRFQFTPIYADDTPSYLPSHEFFTGLMRRAGEIARFGVRLCAVVVAWLLFIPLGTCWLCRLSFVRSIDQLPLSLELRLDTVAGDAICGCALSIGIVLMFLGIASLRDFLYHDVQAFRDLDFEPPQPVAAAAEAGRGDGGGELEQLPPREGGAEQVDGGARPANMGAPVQDALAGAAAAPPPANAAAVVDDAVEMDFIDGDAEMPFEELIGMQGPLQILCENVLTVLASNAIFLACFCLIPFTAGRLCLLVSWRDLAPAALGLWLDAAAIKRLRPAPLSSLSSVRDQLTVVLGYVVITTLAAAWATVAVLLQRRWVQSPVVAHVLSIMRQLFVFAKVSVILFVELGTFPFCCGCWLDICTLDLVDASPRSRAEAAMQAPFTCILLHWLVGIIYMLYVSLFISMLREVMRAELFWFLRNPDDPNYHPFRDLVEESVPKHARRIVLSGLIYGPLVALFVWAPVQLCRWTLPSVFPFTINFQDPYTEVPADIILFHVCLPFTIEHFHPRETVKLAIRRWFVSVGNFFAIAHHILPPADDVHDVPLKSSPDSGALSLTDLAIAVQKKQIAAKRDKRKRQKQKAKARAAARQEGSSEAAIAGEPQDAIVPPAAIGPDGEVGVEQNEVVPTTWLALRGIVVSVLAWLCALVVASACIVLPIAIGRSLFSWLGLPISHDLYTFGSGCYLLWASVNLQARIRAVVGAQSVAQLAQHTSLAVVVGCKLVAIGTLGIGFIPLGIGLFFELVVVIPVRVPTDETPCHYLYQDWALGLILLKVWARLVMLQPPHADNALQREFTAMKIAGVVNLNAMRVLRGVIFPVSCRVAVALCAPYAFTHGALRLGGATTQTVSACFRYSYVACASVAVAAYFTKAAIRGLRDLHLEILKERFQVGTTLGNYYVNES